MSSLKRIKTDFHSCHFVLFPADSPRDQSDHNAGKESEPPEDQHPLEFLGANDLNNLLFFMFIQFMRIIRLC